MNQVKYGINLISQKSYSLFIYGITQILSWVEFIRITSNILVEMSVGFSISQLITIGANITSYMKSLSRINSDILNTINITVASTNQLMRLSSDTNEKFNLIISISFFKALSRVLSTVNAVLDIGVTATIATLIKLEIYDAQTLGDMDSQSLGSLDSVIIT